jgi:serine phosphatase RsbU (regulator of sigma subunit)
VKLLKIIPVALLFLFILLIFKPLQTYAQGIVVENSDVLVYAGHKIKYFVEPKRAMSIDEILSQEVQMKFSPNDKKLFNLPPGREGIWFKITVQNRTGEDIWIELGGQMVGKADFYRPDSTGNFSDIVRTGTMRPKENKEFPVGMYWVKLGKVQQPETYFFRIETAMPRDFVFKIGTLKVLTAEKEIADYTAASFMGMLLIFGLYNLLLGIITRNGIYFWYAAYLLSGLLTVTADNHPFFVVLLDSPTFLFKYYFVWHNLFMLFAGIFVHQYLNLGQQKPLYGKIVRAFSLILGVLFPVANLLGLETVILMQIFPLIVMPFYLFLWILGFILLRSGYKAARFYLLGWSLMFFGIFVTIFTVVGLIPHNYFTQNGMYIGVAAEIIMFSLALGDRLNVLRKEKEQAHNENIRLVKEQNEILEKRVLRRTEALTSANTELEQQREELISLNRMLEFVNQNLQSTTENLEASIRYALRIQEVILPEESDLKNYFSDFFALYLPKDIVSGDFYWFYDLKDGSAVLILADCTGHGVPGAFMSMIGNTLLYEMVIINQILSPAKIIHNLHAAIKTVLKQEKTKNNDGMDIMVCYFRKTDEHCIILFEGAKRNLFYADEFGNLSEIKGSRFHVGGNSEIASAFTNKEIVLPRGANLYLMSDGFIDQNNERRQKFGKKNLLALLAENSKKKMNLQKEILQKALQNHQGNNPQRDDITLIAVTL